MARTLWSPRVPVSPGSPGGTPAAPFCRAARGRGRPSAGTDALVDECYPTLELESVPRFSATTLFMSSFIALLLLPFFSLLFFPPKKCPFDYRTFLLCPVKLFIDHILGADNGAARDSAQNALVDFLAGCSPPMGPSWGAYM